MLPFHGSFRRPATIHKPMRSNILVLVASIATLCNPTPSLKAGETDKDVIETRATAKTKAPPLPLHTFEGTGGIFAVPLGYLVNPGAPETVFGLPAASTTYIKAGRKNLETLAITETFFERLEVGYAASRFGIGSLHREVTAATTVDLERNDIFLHHINFRLLALKEDSFGAPLPAITAGFSVNSNENISDINRKLGGALTAIGYTHDTGIDFTVTATKALPLFGHPLLATVGGRFSQGSYSGYLGYGDTYYATVEGSLAYCVTQWLWIAGEFRQKASPYAPIPGLVRREQNIWTAGAVFIINPHATVTLGYGHLGNLVNTNENTAFALQFKYEM